MLALHGGWVELVVKGEVVFVLLELPAKVAVSGGGGAGDYGDVSEEGWEGELLVVVEYAVGFELCEYGAAFLLEVADGVCRVDVEDVE